MSATEDNCSVHGVCFDNGMCGNCDADCEQFLEGECEAAMEVAKALYDIHLAQGTVEETLQEYYSDVELWLRRGKHNQTDFELLVESLGYKEDT